MRLIGDKAGMEQSTKSFDCMMVANWQRNWVGIQTQVEVQREADLNRFACLVIM